MSTYDKETEAIKAFWDDSTIIDEQSARIAELEMHLAAAAETIAQHARADAAAWGASFEQQNEHAANATAQIRALLNGGMPVRDDTRRRDSRIAELEAEVTAAHGELAAIEVERRGWQRSQETMRRLLALVEEWERANCRSSTYDCAEQVRAILRGEGPQGWEMRAGKEGGE